MDEKSLDAQIEALRTAGHTRLISWLAAHQHYSSLITAMLGAMAETKAELYLVGGSVRDILENRREIKDIDLMVTGLELSDLGQILEELKKIRSLGIREIVHAGKHFPVYKLSVKWSKNQIDVALARTETSAGRGHRDFTVSTAGVQAEADSCRRDFRLNALFFRFSRGEHHPDGEIIDYQYGLKSLVLKEIKAVGNPEERFIEDPLRMLRAIRQKNERRGFTIEEDTWNAIVRNMPVLIHTISSERIAEELVRSLMANPRQTYIDLRDSGALGELLPELAAITEEEEKWLLSCLSALSHFGKEINDTLLLSALLSGAALNELKKQDPPPPGKGELDAFITRCPEAIARRLTLPHIRDLKTMVHHFLLLMNYGTLRHRKAAAEKIMSGNPLLTQLLLLYHSYMKAMGLEAVDFKSLLAHMNACKPLINGTDLLNAGIVPGAHMSFILEEVREKELNGELLTGEEAISFSFELYREMTLYSKTQ